MKLRPKTTGFSRVTTDTITKVSRSVSALFRSADDIFLEAMITGCPSCEIFMSAAYSEASVFAAIFFVQGVWFNDLFRAEFLFDTPKHLLC